MTITKKGNHYYDDITHEEYIYMVGGENRAGRLEHLRSFLSIPAKRTLFQRLVDWLTGAPKKSVTPVTLDDTTPEQEAIYEEAPWLRNAWDGFDDKEVEK